MRVRVVLQVPVGRHRLHAATQEGFQHDEIVQVQQGQLRSFMQCQYDIVVGAAVSRAALNRRSSRDSRHFACCGDLVDADNLYSNLASNNRTLRYCRDKTHNAAIVLATVFVIAGLSNTDFCLGRSKEHQRSGQREKRQSYNAQDQESEAEPGIKAAACKQLIQHVSLLACP